MLLLSLVSTGLALYVPLLARDLVDRALLQRDAQSLLRTVLLFLGMTAASFALNVVSGLRYTRVSAEILFDMRLAVYRHLQRLSPRFYARARIGDLVSRVGNDIAEVQRVAAESVLACVGNVLFLAGSIVMLLVLDARLFALSAVFIPPALWALQRYRRRLAAAVAEMRQRSADIGSFLVETLQGMSLVTASNAQERETARFRDRNDAFLRALNSMQLLTYLSGGLPGLILAGSAAAVFWLGGNEVIAGRLSLGTFVAFMAYQARLLPPLQALMGLYASLATARVSLGRVQELFDAPVDVRAARRDAARRSPRRHRLRRCHALFRQGRSGPRGRVLQRPLRRGGGDRRGERQRQVHHRRAAAADARPRFRRRAPRRPRPAQPAHSRRAPARCARRAGAVPVPRDDRGEHPLRAADCDPGRDRCRGGAGRDPGLHRGPSGEVRHGRGRARPRPLRGRAAAHRDRARVPEQPRGAGSRRADGSAGSFDGAPGGGGLRGPDEGPHHDPDLAPLPAGEPRRSRDRPRTGPGRGGRAAARAAAARRALRAAVRRGAAGRGRPGLKVAVVDSGINPDHPHVGNVLGGVGIDADGRAHADWLDRIGHGTAVAAAIHEKAPHAALYAVKVFDRALETRVAALVAAIDWAIGSGVRLVNLSLGVSDQQHEQTLCRAVERAVTAGVLIVAAVDPLGPRWLPGSLPGVVPVRLDWECPREEVRAGEDESGWFLLASGYPREIPGVPRERNLKGISFAVANATGELAHLLEASPDAALGELRARLSA